MNPEDKTLYVADMMATASEKDQINWLCRFVGGLMGFRPRVKNRHVQLEGLHPHMLPLALLHYLKSLLVVLF